ncbi:MAG: DUF115 domain-containing protein [Treponema sp.]|jgi:hypothetical protein|nr:DUF115 domain-containing protein [Treponema sp.]
MPAAQLHSHYNPALEAERYIEALKIRSGIEYFILIEPGTGYLIPVLKRRFPGAKIIALHTDTIFSADPAAVQLSQGVPSWFPGSSSGLQEFLERNIPDIEAQSVQIIEWRPSLKAYGEAYRLLLCEAAAFIRRADANARTAGNFGRRWLKNFFKNISLPRSFLSPAPFEKPVIIAGSGPGLEKALPVLTPVKNDVFIIAASSAVAALSSAGIASDVVISTDGGPWALLHLNECFRSKNEYFCTAPVKKPALAVNFCAALPSQCSRLPFLVMNDGSLWQSLVLKGLGIPSVRLPQRGTVTASALDLALLLSRGKIFITGMDLAVHDIRTHARPYGFDPLLRDTAFRLNPFYSQSFVRAGEINAGGSHRIYAAWFNEQLKNWPDRIFSLGKNNPVFAALKKAELPAADPAKEQLFENPFTSVPAPPFSPEAAVKILDSALADRTLSGALSAELSPLLFSGSRNAAAIDIQAALHRLNLNGAQHG